jgi:hypothetical protein
MINAFCMHKNLPHRVQTKTDGGISFPPEGDCEDFAKAGVQHQFAIYAAF